MQHVIADASILGFVPTAYPAGIILAEQWDETTRSIVRFTGWVSSIEISDEWAEQETLGRGADLQWALIERASRA